MSCNICGKNEPRYTIFDDKKIVFEICGMCLKNYVIDVLPYVSFITNTLLGKNVDKKQIEKFLKILLDK